jgi:hypothetical protein
VKTYRLKKSILKELKRLWGDLMNNKEKHTKEDKRELVITSIPEILSLILRFLKISNDFDLKKLLEKLKCTYQAYICVLRACVSV